MLTFRKILFTLLTFLTFQCGQYEKVEETIAIERGFTTVNNDPKLADYLESLTLESKKGRIASSINSRINRSKVYKNYNPKNKRTSYTLPLLMEKPNQFDNLILVDNNGVRENTILRLIPTSVWLSSRPRRAGYESFSGTIEILDLGGIAKASTNFENGKAISNNTLQSGRTNGCTTSVDVQWASITVGDYTSYKEAFFTITTICEGSGGGGSSGGSGGGGGGSSGGGGGTSGGRPTDGSGVIDPTDISYLLRPVKPGDDLNNPYDGMQARDNNGVIYTYNAELNVWLMPDLVFLQDQGQLILDSNLFDGQVLSLVITIGIGEPTQIGKILIGGLVLAVFVYEIYQVNSIKENTRQHCADMAFLCRTTYGYKNMDCSTCQSYCIAQGFWDFVRCPLRP